MKHCNYFTCAFPEEGPPRKARFKIAGKMKHSKKHLTFYRCREHTKLFRERGSGSYSNVKITSRF